MKKQPKWLCVHEWPNGMGTATRVHKKSPNDEPSDVIELLLKPGTGRGKPARYFMNVIDALAIIHALSIAATMAAEQGSPIQPEK